MDRSNKEGNYVVLKQDILFFHIIFIVAASGFAKDVQHCFSIDLTSWGDFCLWNFVINDLYIDPMDNIPKTRLMKASGILFGIVLLCVI